MKKFALIICGLLFATFAFAQSGLIPLMPPYWIVGTVADIPEAAADGRYVDFYKSDEDLAAGRYAQGVIIGNQFILNAFSIFPAPLIVGETYKVATERRTDNYGANGTVAISGFGWDEVKEFNLVLGGGIAQPLVSPAGEPAPTIRVWFGNRLYQPQLYGADVPEDKKLPFIVKETGNLKIEVTIPDPYQLDEANSYAMEIRNPLGQTSSYNLQEAAGFKASAVATKPFVVEASYPELPMPTEGKGEYSFTFHASSKGNIASATSVTQQALVTVMGGPLRLIGTPLTFPSPYSVKAHGIVSVQYTLSNNANIEIYLISVGGERVWRKICDSGAEGGSAGTNKVAWNGTTDMGYTVGSGIYVGTIVARDEGKLLGKFKLTVIP